MAHRKTPDPPQIAFECARCHTPIGDPLYHGPAGHAPRNLCYDCWCIHWSDVERKHLLGEDPSELERALWLVSQGFTQEEAADQLSRHRNTIGNWFRGLRKKGTKFCKSVVQKATSRYCTAQRGNHVR